MLFYDVSHYDLVEFLQKSAKKTSDAFLKEIKSSFLLLVLLR